ncbi:formin-like protein 5 [Oryzias melastigma]|uniref:formin-like protein 5 n=1 Tax=Oryzias melastigma TaxID=30732 RepID=UPI000CF7BF2B|nr:formin-like protein 5 [Oryzias melastigma]
MATLWHEEDDELKIGAVVGGMRSKPRFSFHEIRVLLHAVKRNRYVLLKKFNQGVSAEAKKQTWAEITEEINGLGENQREVRQIMKKWADLKCDGKRRITAMRGPNGNNLRKKNMGAVERMVHKILMLTPETDSISDRDLDEGEDLSKYTTPPSTTHFSYLNMSNTSHSFSGETFEVSPTSTPDKDLGEPLQSSSDVDAPDEEEPIFENDSAFSSYPAPLPPPPRPAPLLDYSQLKARPVHTYSRSSQNQNSSRAVASTSSSFPPAAPPPPPPAAPVLANGTSSPLTPIAPSPPPPAGRAPPTASSSVCPPIFTSLPTGAPQHRVREQVSALAAQSLRQQTAGRVLLSSVSQSLAALAQSVQLLVESQQEFVQEALLLQRETVEVLRDFSNTALGMLRDKAGGGQPHPHAVQRF